MTFALGVLAQGGDDQVHLLALQVGMRLGLLTGTSSSFTPSLSAIRRAMSTSRPWGAMSTPTKP
jgi:hypothetical protein